MGVISADGRDIAPEMTKATQVGFQIYASVSAWGEQSKCLL